MFKFIHEIIKNPGLNNQTSSPYVAAFIFLGAIWVPIGAFFLIGVFQKRHYLSIETICGKRKVVFKDKIETAKIAEFLKNINEKYNYNII